jgi:DNA-binding transcriptional LysR family regulator
MPKMKQPPRGPHWTVANVPTEVPDWEAARIFLEVSRCGSFRAAAQKLAQSVNALRRTVEKFEKDLGVQLLTRHVGGVQLTEEGDRIAQAALRMEEAAFGLVQARHSSGTQANGEVRISITEGLGTFWLLPHIARFQEDDPGLIINMRCGQQPADLHRLEADLSVQLQRPTEPDLKVVKLCSMHIIMWASRAYIAKYGRPKSAADLGRHRLITQASEDRAQWEADYRREFGEMSSSSSPVVLRSNSNSALVWAIAGGAGIGALPSYASAVNEDFIPLDLIKPIPMVVWLVYHPGAKNVPRIRKAMDWIVKAFDPRSMPWFRDEFIHPDKFPQLYKGPALPGVLAIRPKGFF